MQSIKKSSQSQSQSQVKVKVKSKHCYVNNRHEIPIEIIDLKFHLITVIIIIIMTLIFDEHKSSIDKTISKQINV